MRRPVSGRWADVLVFVAVAAGMAVVALNTNIRWQRNACWIVGAACAFAAAVELIAIGRRKEGRDE